MVIFSKITRAWLGSWSLCRNTYCYGYSLK